VDPVGLHPPLSEFKKKIKLLFETFGWTDHHFVEGYFSRNEDILLRRAKPMNTGRSEEFFFSVFTGCFKELD
jgi:hypothetical protein